MVGGKALLKEIAPHAEVRTLFLLESEAEGPAGDIKADRIVLVNNAILQKVTGLESVEALSCAAEVMLPPPADFASLPKGSLQRLLVLDRCQDPGNMGTLLRTACAFGWDGVVLLPGCTDAHNDKCLRASRGAAFKVPIASASVADWQAIVQHHGLASLAAEVQAGGSGGGAVQGTHRLGLEEVERQLTASRLCLVLGNEGQGLSPQVAQHCTSVNIPMPGNLMESLNVSVAGGICMFALTPSAPQLLADVVNASKSGSLVKK